MGLMILEMPSVYQSWDHVAERRGAMQGAQSRSKTTSILRLMRQNYGFGLLPLTLARPMGRKHNNVH